MGTYEEMVVDGHVDAAWLQFRVRLADHLATMEEDDEVLLRCESTPRVTFRLSAPDADSIEALLASTNLGSNGAPSSLDLDLLDSLGLTSGLIVEQSDADFVALAVMRGIREGCGIVHPSFVSVVEGDLTLVDEPTELVSPAAEPSELPDSVRVHSRDELREWVDRALEPKFGHTPHKDEDGIIWVKRDEHRMAIWVSSGRPIIQLAAVIARDVDPKKARQQILKLTNRFYHYRFYLSDGRFMVAREVDGQPFVPEHLQVAMSEMLRWLERRSPKIKRKVTRSEPVAQETKQALTYEDTELMLLFGLANDRSAMRELAEGLAAGDRSKLVHWRFMAREAEDLAADQANSRGHGAAQSALIDAIVAWRTVRSVVREVLREQEPSR